MKTKKKEVLQNVADRLFKSNPNIDTLHLATNGQAFTDKEVTKNYAKQFSDTKVYTFERAGKVAKKEVGATGKNKRSREELLKRYKELFEKEAPKNIKDETLLKKVEELEKQPSKTE